MMLALAVANLAVANAAYTCTLQLYTDNHCEDPINQAKFSTQSYTDCKTEKWVSWKGVTDSASSMSFSPECSFAEVFDDGEGPGYEDNCRVQYKWSRATKDGTSQCMRSIRSQKICYSFDIRGIHDDLQHDVGGYKICAAPPVGQGGRLVESAMSVASQPVVAAGLVFSAMLIVGLVGRWMTKKISYTPVVDVV